MKSKIFILLLLLSFNCGNSQYLNNVELYITPRNVSYGWHDNGVFQFNLERKSIKVPYENRTYKTITTKDSVFELFYQKVKMPKILFKNFKALINDTPNTKRIMIVISKKDTLFIDRNYNVIKGDKCYQISSELKEFIELCMPTEIKESWMLDLPGR